MRVDDNIVSADLFLPFEMIIFLILVLTDNIQVNLHFYFQWLLIVKVKL